MIFQEEIELYKRLLPNIKVVFDVGCRDDNIFLEINPNIEVHLFDPNSKMENANKFALGNEEVERDFYYSYGSFLKREEEPKFKGLHSNIHRVKITTLKKYCNDREITKIDLLKIDTEGYDFEVILGAGDLIKNIDFIQFEEFGIYYNNRTSSEIFDYLNKFGFEISNIGGKPMNYLATKK